MMQILTNNDFRVNKESQKFHENLTPVLYAIRENKLNLELLRQ